MTPSERMAAEAYDEWRVGHDKKRVLIIMRLNGYTEDEIKTIERWIGIWEHAPQDARLGVKEIVMDESDCGSAGV